MSVSLQPGICTALGAGVRRILAPNPGPMTGPGTNTYLLGEKRIAVIDPGPADAGHVEAIVDQAGGPIEWILLTHTHRDHSPAAALLQARTGAAVLGLTAPDDGRQDVSVRLDKLLQNGDRLNSDDFCLTSVHTPGHASNHLCYLLEGEGWLFTGDHIMNGSTVVIAPPDGHMGEYLASLRRLKSLALNRLAPGHGELMNDPDAVVDWIIEHRLEREAKVADALRAAKSASVDELLPGVYDDVDPRLHRVAKLSLLAHLIKLQEDGAATVTDGVWMAV